MGTPPTELAKFRRDMAAAAGFPKGTCTTTVLALTVGLHNDPAYRLRREQFVEWSGLWNEADNDARSRIAEHWKKAAENLLDHSTRWNRTTGPATATLST